jgi:hypothetical protein
VYWEPSAVVTRQYSPLLSPFVAPVRDSIRVPSSRLGRHCLEVASLTSSTAEPPSDRVTFSPSQHRSPVFLPSIMQDL